jgi:hypothetical protein
MRLRMTVTGFALGSLLTLATTQVVSFAQQDQDPQEMERMMELWQKIATPGAAHEKLGRGIGEWDVVTRMWMAGPGQPPMESVGTSKSEWILGGRFVKSTFQGSMMGMPFEGLGITGYDNYKKKYVSIWFDSNSTAVHTSEGLLDQTGDVISYFGTMDEWMTDEHDKPVKYVDRFIDDDHAVFEIHDLGIVPGDTKVIEMVYTRKGLSDAGDAAKDKPGAVTESPTELAAALGLEQAVKKEVAAGDP